MASIFFGDPVDEHADPQAELATARVAQGQYTAQVTRQLPAVRGVAAGTAGAAAIESKQALIRTLPIPSSLLT